MGEEATETMEVHFMLDRDDWIALYLHCHDRGWVKRLSWPKRLTVAVTVVLVVIVVSALFGGVVFSIVHLLFGVWAGLEPEKIGLISGIIGFAFLSLFFLIYGILHMRAITREGAEVSYKKQVNRGIEAGRST